jgi:hypothetical protein
LLAFRPAQAGKRIALVIGNGAYQRVSKLPNPPKDAKVISGMLQSAGFDVVESHENLGIREMRRAINDFADTARDADMAVVYYAGHGMEVNGINYLIPIDAVLDRDTDIPYEAISLDNLVQVLEPARRLRLVMLDACRDNPFTRTMKRTVGSRSVGRGLSAVEPTSVNTLISYAAKAGSFALDGDEVNSPYALALLNHLATPGLDLRIAFGRVRDEVLNVTRNKQEPFVYGSLGGGTVSLVDGLEGSGSALKPQAGGEPLLDHAGQAWLATKDTASMAVLEDFIRQFGVTPYGSMARARLEELRKSNIAATSTAMARHVSMGNVSVNLPPPRGFCELLDTNSSDKVMLTTVGGLLSQSGNKLLGMSAECGQLADWRSSRRQLLDDYAQYQTSLALIDTAPSETIQQTCATLGGKGNKIVSDQTPELKARVEAALKKVKMNQTSFIGVFAEEPRACYAGLIQQLHTAAGTDKTQLCLFAVTAVKNRTVFVYRFTVYTGSDSIVDGLAKLKSDVAAFYAAN